MSVGFEDLTVGIVTYRRPEAVAETLRTLDDVPNVNVVINGSTMDEYREVVEGFSDRVRFSQNIRNLGVAATGNRLVIESNTRFVIWATDSCEFQPGWWQHVLELLNSD